jgi:hypothetical protein
MDEQYDAPGAYDTTDSYDGGSVKPLWGFAGQGKRKKPKEEPVSHREKDIAIALAFLQFD